MKKLASIMNLLTMALLLSSVSTIETILNQDINSQGNNMKIMTETLSERSQQANQLVEQSGYPSIKRTNQENSVVISQNLIFLYQKSPIIREVIIIQARPNKVGQKFAQQTFHVPSIANSIQSSSPHNLSTNSDSIIQSSNNISSKQSIDIQLQTGQPPAQNHTIEVDFRNITEEVKVKVLDLQQGQLKTESDGTSSMSKIQKQDKVNNESIEGKLMSQSEGNTDNTTVAAMRPTNIQKDSNLFLNRTNDSMSVMESINQTNSRIVSRNTTENVEQDLEKGVDKQTTILNSFQDLNVTQINTNAKSEKSQSTNVSNIKINDEQKSTAKIDNGLSSDSNLGLPANNQLTNQVNKLARISKQANKNRENVSNIINTPLINFDLVTTNGTNITTKNTSDNINTSSINRRIDYFQNNQNNGKTKQMQSNTSNMNTLINRSSVIKNESLINKKQHNESTLQPNISTALNKTLISTNSSANSTATSVKQIAQMSLNITSLINMNERRIINRQFSGVGLYHDVPVSFMQGQLFRFSGVILNSSSLTFTGTAIYNSINVIFRQFGSLDQFRCTKQFVFGKYDFQLSCRIMRPGRFFLFVFPGAYGFSSSKLRYVRGLDLLTPAIYFNIQQFKPERITLAIQDNRLIIKWDTEAPLTNLTISQKNLPKKQYLLSNYHKKFEVPFSDFKQFESSIVKIEISHADSSDGSLSSINTPFSQDTATFQFQAIQHFHDKSEDGNYNITPSIPWRVASGEKFKFNAIFEEDIKNEVFITLPNGILAKVNFTRTLPANATIRARTPLQLQLTLIMPGPYIIEINAVTGLAIINRPIYVGEGFPLLPDNHDLISLYANQLSSSQKMTILQQYVTKATNLKEKKAQPSVSSSLNEKREYLLYLLNGLRTKYKVDSVVIDQQLNNIAQFHSDDMTKNNYFGHNSLNGDQAKDRALKFNFTNSISQNIAKALTLIEAHLGLERSASHLETSIKSEWTRVGIGISVDSKDYYVVVFQFSNRDLTTKPLASQQLQSYRQQLIKLTLQKNPQLKQNSRISKYIEEWLSTSRNTNVFQYLFSKQNLTGSLSALSFITSFSDNMIEVIRGARYLEGKYSAKQFGIAVQMKKGQNSVEGYAVFL